MVKNVGTIDRIIRFVIGGAIIVWGWQAQSLWGIVGVGLVLTAACNFCGLYKVFGLNTCNNKKCDK